MRLPDSGKILRLNTATIKQFFGYQKVVSNGGNLFPLSESSEKALEAINQFVYSEPFEALDSEEDHAEYIACLYLRNARGEIAWATFLNEAGVFTDAHNGQRDCGYFYFLLNALENKEYAKEVELKQRVGIEQDYAKAIPTSKELST